MDGCSKGIPNIPIAIQVKVGNRTLRWIIIGTDWNQPKEPRHGPQSLINTATSRAGN